MRQQVFNIIICGVGGQGVLTISNLIRKMAIERGFACEGATMKGGAQRMGSVSSEIRIVMDGSDAIISSQIPNGAADLLLALEPWEALRFSSKCNVNTKCVINEQVETLYVERYVSPDIKDPVEKLKTIFTEPIIENFSALSKEISGNKKSANIFLLQEAITKEYLPFTTTELEAQLN